MSDLAVIYFNCLICSILEQAAVHSDTLSDCPSRIHLARCFFPGEEWSHGLFPSSRLG